jgi:hypothetical protein
MNLRCFVLMSAIASVATLARGTSYTWDLTNQGEDYYTDPANAGPGIAQAISDATAWWSNAAHNGDQITLLFGSGTYTFICPASPVESVGAINVNYLNPPADANGNQGRLIIQGRGDLGANATNLIFTGTTTPGQAVQIVDQLEISGYDTSHVTFTNFHLGRTFTAPDGATRSVTQGTVVSAGTNTLNGTSNYYVLLDVPPGFPTPADVYDTVRFPIGNGGRWLRTFTYVNHVPEIANVSEQQDGWNTYQDLSTTQNPSRFELDGLERAPTYQTGDIVGIKSKHGQDSGRFTNSSDIDLDHIRWTDCTRVAFVGTSNDITFNNNVTDRGDDIDGLTPCLALNEGGPQFNPNDSSTSTNIFVNYNTSVGEGDDAIALFGVVGGIVSYNNISDDWARGINLAMFLPYSVQTYGNVLTRNITIPAVLPNIYPTDSPALPLWALLSLAGLLCLFAWGKTSFDRSCVKISLPIFLFALGLLLDPARGASYTWNLADTAQDYYVNPANAGPGMAEAISDVNAWFAGSTHQGDQITLQFASGTYTFVCPALESKSQQEYAAAIDISNVNPGVNAQGQPGRLILQGMGEFGANATNLIVTGETVHDGSVDVYSERTVLGTGCQHVTITQLRFGKLVTVSPSGATGFVTQGTVVINTTGTLNGTSNTYTVVDVPPGFPTPADVWDNVTYPAGQNGGRFTETFVYVNNVPQIKDDTEPQDSWKTYQDISTAQYPRRFELDGMNHQHTYSTGDIIGIKSKHGVIPFWFQNAIDVTIDHVRFTDASSMWFTGTADQLVYTNNQVDRGNDIDNLTPCLSTNDNGFTVTSPATSVLVANNNLTAQGDDSIALSNVLGATISGNTISDEFARALYLNPIPNYNALVVYDNTLIRSPTVPADYPENAPDGSPTLPLWALLLLACVLAFVGKIGLTPVPRGVHG